MKRIEFIDSLKGFAIFCVLWGHSIQYLNNSSNFFENPVFAFIYSFHMPIFFMISGFFFKSSLKLSFQKFLIDKILLLLLPCFIWGAIFILVKLSNFFINDDYIFYWKREFLSIINPIKWPFWFLKELFLSYLITYVFYQIFTKDFIVFALSIFLVLLLPSSFDEQRLLLPMFLGGIYLNENYKSLIDKSNLILLSSSLLFLLCLFFWRADYTIYKTNFMGIVNWRELNFNVLNIEIYFFRVVIGFVGSIVFFFLFEKIYKKNWLTKNLERIGKITLSIYVVQLTLLEIFLNKILDFSFVDNIWVYNLFITPLISLIVLFLCETIHKILIKNKYVDFLLFGGKINWMNSKQFLIKH